MEVESRTEGGSILVVDDNPINAQVAEGHLSAAGYSALFASSGAEAIAAFQDTRPDLVLLDVLMPGMDGFETCRRLRELPGGRDVAIVFLTSLADLESHRQALDSGADDFLTKPIHRTELLIRVRSLLWVKRLKDELTRGYDLISSQRNALIETQEQKAQCIAFVVHDLKNPLTAIVGNAEFLLTNPAFGGDDREALRDIEESARAMQRMVVDLLDISRSEEGVLVPAWGSVDVARLIEELQGEGRRRDRAGRRRFDCSLGGDVSTIEADPDLLRRLLENLLDNALKYSPPDGRIVLAAQAEGSGWIGFRVGDEGPGIPAAFRERVFDKYFRLEREAAALGRVSRGLGLAFCRLAAELHGGRIWVEENRPRGSLFCVRLPIRRP